MSAENDETQPVKPAPKPAAPAAGTPPPLKPGTEIRIARQRDVDRLNGGTAESR